MSEATKVTPGPWEAVGNLVRSPMHQPDGLPRGVQIVECMDGYSQPFTEEAKANASLIAEAGTVHHETGLTPRHLVEQRDALYEALRRLTREYVFTRTMDGTSAQDCETMECVRSARTALALVKGEQK